MSQRRRARPQARPEPGPAPLRPPRFSDLGTFVCTLGWTVCGRGRVWWAWHPDHGWVWVPTPWKPERVEAWSAGVLAIASGGRRLALWQPEGGEWRCTETVLHDRVRCRAFPGGDVVLVECEPRSGGRKQAELRGRARIVVVVRVVDGCLKRVMQARAPSHRESVDEGVDWGAEPIPYFDPVKERVTLLVPGTGVFHIAPGPFQDGIRRTWSLMAPGPWRKVGRLGRWFVVEGNRAYEVDPSSGNLTPLPFPAPAPLALWDAWLHDDRDLARSLLTRPDLLPGLAGSRTVDDPVDGDGAFRSSDVLRREDGSLVALVTPRGIIPAQEMKPGPERTDLLARTSRIDDGSGEIGPDPHLALLLWLDPEQFLPAVVARVLGNPAATADLGTALAREAGAPDAAAALRLVASVVRRARFGPVRPTRAFRAFLSALGSGLGPAVREACASADPVEAQLGAVAFRTAAWPAVEGRPFLAPGERPWAEVRALLDHPSDEVRVAASEAVPFLIWHGPGLGSSRLLRDPCPAVRRRGAEMLAFGREVAPGEIVEAAAVAVGDPCPAVRIAALRSFCGALPWPARSPLLERVAGDEDGPVRRAALAELATGLWTGPPEGREPVFLAVLLAQAALEIARPGHSEGSWLWPLDAGLVGQLSDPVSRLSVPLFAAHKGGAARSLLETTTLLSTVLAIAAGRGRELALGEGFGAILALVLSDPPGDLDPTPLLKPLLAGRSPADVLGEAAYFRWATRTDLARVLAAAALLAPVEPPSPGAVDGKRRGPQALHHRLRNPGAPGGPRRYCMRRAAELALEPGAAGMLGLLALARAGEREAWQALVQRLVRGDPYAPDVVVEAAVALAPAAERAAACEALAVSRAVPPRLRRWLASEAVRGTASSAG